MRNYRLPATELKVGRKRNATRGWNQGWQTALEERQKRLVSDLEELETGGTNEKSRHATKSSHQRYGGTQLLSKRPEMFAPGQ